jgi:proteic killer suppression protein
VEIEGISIQEIRGITMVEIGGISLEEIRHLSFGDETTELFFRTGKVKKAGWANIKTVVARKLDMIHYASILSDLKSPPGNRLEALSGDLAGYHSVRVNDQWRVVFRWTAPGPTEVRVTDYH